MTPLGNKKVEPKRLGSATLIGGALKPTSWSVQQNDGTLHAPAVVVVVVIVVVVMVVAQGKAGVVPVRCARKKS